MAQRDKKTGGARDAGSGEGNHPNCKFVPGTFWMRLVCVSLQILIYKDLRICFSPVLVHTQLLKMLKEAPPDH